LWADVARLRWRDLWLPNRLNWWIGVVFAVGAFLFALGAFLSLFPVAASYWTLGSEQINLIFFIGSLPFTTAAWLQLMQSANAGGLSTSGEVKHKRFRLFGWYPADAGWLSCALQFAGTLLFNLNTYNALSPSANWIAQNLSIWLPDMFGSIFFLASGYLAFVETCHSYWAWMPHLLSWRITFVNLLGCIFFMVSAVLSFIPLQPQNFDASTASLLFTLLGALAFFTGALLLLPEASSDAASAD
jgi:hypothetical protein